MELCGYRKINKYLTDWCKSHGFKVKCRLGADFEYDSTTKVVYYSFVISEKHDKLFESICKDYLPNVEKCDNFILSFFHELGHYMTDDDYSDDEWDKYYKLLKKLRKKQKLTLKDYKKYYLSQIEFDATMWACNYINNNVDIIADFNKNLTPLVLEFFRKNNVEIEE